MTSFRKSLKSLMWIIRKWLWRRFQRHLDIQDTLALALGILAFCLAYPNLKDTGIVLLFGFYLCLALWQIWLKMKDSFSKHRYETRIIGNLFHLLNTELFANSNYTRLTLFKIAPFNKKYLIPFSRYKKGVYSYMHAADRSNARYLEGRGTTGMAWSDPPDHLTFQALPSFETHGTMVAYYQSVLDMDEADAQVISHYMQNVTAIGSYVFLDSGGQLSAVLSLDIVGAEVSECSIDDASREYVITFPSEGTQEDGLLVDSDSLHALLNSVGVVLDSIRERRYE